MAQIPFIVICFLALIPYGQATTSLYADIPYVDEVCPRDLFELVRDQHEGLCIVQFYNASAPDSNDFASNYSIAAKSMLGYARLTSINMDNHLLTNLVMSITSTPTYVFYGFYKHMPETFTSLRNVDDLHEETSKQLVRLFEERSVYRLVYNKLNMEMGSGDIDFKLLKSTMAWILVFYKRDHPKTEKIADIWKELVEMYHERVQFGSVNNPLYKILSLEDWEYPVVKFYAKGNKNARPPETYTGKMSIEALSYYLDEKIMISEMKPKQITNVNVVLPCLKRRFCIFTFLPHIPEKQKKALELLTAECSKHGRHAWAWYWNLYNEQPDIERAFGIIKTSNLHPVIVVLNVHAATFMKLSLVEDMCEDVLKDIVESIKEDIGFEFNITAKDLPDIKPFDEEILRDEL